MTTRELFEMASMDVLGLLDEQERASFEDAFRAATPAVQAQLRREQVRFSEMDRILPDVEAPVGLRARVMAAVREAIAAVRTEPIARIGAGPARLWFNATPIWRAACIGFATASLVLAGFGYKVTQDNRTITDTALSNLEAIKLASPGLPDLLLKPRLQQVAFSPLARDAGSTKAVKAVAKLFVDLDSRTACLICDGLPEIGGEYTLVIESSQNNGARSVKTFQAGTGKVYVPIQSIDVQNLGRLEIRSPKGEGGRSDVLLVAGDV